MKDLGTLLDDALQAIFRPKAVVRLEVVRIFAPLAILGFMSTRLAHPIDWLANTGFRIPDIAGDWRQRAHFTPVDPWLAYTVCVAIVVSALATAAGAFTRWSAGLLAALLVYVALADRLSAFTVSKIGPVIVLALALSPSGTRWSVDAWRRKRKDKAYVPPVLVGGGCVSFFQLFLPVFYFSSGIYKARGDWFEHYNPTVLFTHLHDSYQTPVSWLLANHLPAFAWTVLQWITLVFEVGAPLWFALRWTRT
ncbi:MAG: HTTM domain-containing protein, partial [Acidobacteriota bacterium]